MGCINSKEQKTTTTDAEGANSGGNKEVEVDSDKKQARYSKDPTQKERKQSVVVSPQTIQVAINEGASFYLTQILVEKKICYHACMVCRHLSLDLKLATEWLAFFFREENCTCSV